MVAWTTQYFQLVTDMINKGTQICDFSDRREDMFDLRCNSTHTSFTKRRKIIGKRQERHRMENSNDVLVSDLVEQTVMESEVFDGKKFMALSLSMRAVNLMEKK